MLHILLTKQRIDSATKSIATEKYLDMQYHCYDRCAHKRLYHHMLDFIPHKALAGTA